MIKINLCLSKIDKSRIKESNGKKYIDLILRETPNDKYGNDYMVVESVTKEENQRGVKGNILGNGKKLGGGSGSSSKPSGNTHVSQDDLPY